MPFTEANDGKSKGEYQAGVSHVASGLGLTLTIGSNNADGTISEEVADQVFNDLKDLLGSDPRFTIMWGGRSRQVSDAWTPIA